MGGIEPGVLMLAFEETTLAGTGHLSNPSAVTVLTRELRGAMK